MADKGKSDQVSSTRRARLFFIDTGSQRQCMTGMESTSLAFEVIMFKRSANSSLTTWAVGAYKVQNPKPKLFYILARMSQIFPYSIETSNANADPIRVTPSVKYWLTEWPG